MLLSLFYRKIYFQGQLPNDDIPTLVIANHSNAFLDPFIIEAALKRNLIKTVRADWLNHWLIKWMVMLTGAVPLGSRKHQPSGNKSSFQALVSFLSRGKWVIIFPEGASHHNSKLYPFKNGAAHLASQYLSSSNQPLRVIELAVYYSNKSKCNSNVWVKLVRRETYTRTDEFNDKASKSMQWKKNIQNALPPSLHKEEQSHFNWIIESIANAYPDDVSLIADTSTWQKNSQLTHLKYCIKNSKFNLETICINKRYQLLKRLTVDFLILIIVLPIAIYGALSHLPGIITLYLLTKVHSKGEYKWASNIYAIGFAIFPVYWIAMSVIFSFPITLASTISGIIALKYWMQFQNRYTAIRTAGYCLREPNIRNSLFELAEKSLKPLTKSQNPTNNTKH